MNWNILGVLLLAGTILLPFVFGGEINYQLNTSEDQNTTQYNEEIPTNWSYSGIKDVTVNSTYYVTPLGQLVGSLSEGVIYTVEHDGNLLLQVNSINESACNWFAEVNGVSYDLTSSELKVLPVSVNEQFALKFTVKNVDDQNCMINFDLNKQWRE
jgi:hypothetical protein